MGIVHIAGVVPLYVSECDRCGTTFGIAQTIEARRREDGGRFYCPNGHELVFSDNELARTKRELAAKERALESQKKLTEWQQQDATMQRRRADVEQRRSRSLKGHQTRLRKRLAEGQCPCCTVTFADLEKHIAEKHPRYKPRQEKP